MPTHAIMILLANKLSVTSDLGADLYLGYIIQNNKFMELTLFLYARSQERDL